MSKPILRNENWIQKSQHIFEISFQHSKINVKEFLHKLHKKWKFKGLQTFKSTTNETFIIKCTFESYSNIYLMNDEDKLKNYPNIILDKKVDYVKKPNYFWAGLNSPVKRLNESFDFIPDQKEYRIFSNPISITDQNYPIADPVNFQEHMHNIYYHYCDKNVLEVLRYIVNFKLENRIMSICDTLALTHSIMGSYLMYPINDD